MCSQQVHLLIVDCLEVIKADKFNEFKDSVFPALSAKKARSIFIGTTNEVDLNAVKINENTEFPILTEKPILRRKFYQIIKDYIMSLYKTIKG